MSTFTNLLYHVVFSTKYRKPLIEETWQDDLYGYMGGIIREEKGVLLKIGGVEDHIHLLTKFRPMIAVSDMLRLIKTNSSKWVNDHQKVRGGFSWQSGYAAFSVSESQAPSVIEYIASQREHHRKRTFEEELRGMLEKHGMEYDIQYLFEQEPKE